MDVRLPIKIWKNLETNFLINYSMASLEEIERARKARSDRFSKKKKTYTIVDQIGNYNTEDLSEFEIKTDNPGSNNCSCILNNGKFCAKITIHDRNLHLNLISKCKFSGTIVLTKIIEFAKKNKLTVTLTDESQLGDTEIDLRLFKMLQTGQSWYSQYGFKNKLDQYGDIIHGFINSPYKDTTYQDYAIKLGIQLKHGKISVIDEIKQMCDQLRMYLIRSGVDMEDTKYNTLGGKKRRTKRFRY